MSSYRNDFLGCEIVAGSKKMRKSAPPRCYDDAFVSSQDRLVRSTRHTLGRVDTGLMAIATSNTSTTTSAPGTGQSYGAPLATVTTLFFMWGFLTCLNDILIPHLKSIFELNYAAVMLVQFAFFGAYAVFSVPCGWIVERIAYQKTMVLGLTTMAVGALLFIPAAMVPSFPLFLAALIILAAGITALQVSANPYVAVLGPARTA